MLEITNVNWGGEGGLADEGEYELELTDIGSVAFQAKGGTVTMMAESGGSGWDIADGAKEVINTRDLSNRSIFFSAKTGTQLQIRKLKGLLC